MSKYDFALQWLDYLGNSIYNKGHQILKYEGNPEYEISPLNTKIKIGEELGEESDKEKFSYMSFLDFEHMGFAIRAMSDIKWKHLQKAAYLVVRKSRNTLGITYESFRASRMKIEHDAQNRRFRIVGENVIADDRLRVDSGIGPWIIYDANAPKQAMTKRVMPMTKEEMIFALKGNRFGTVEKADEEPSYITEIPMIFSEEKYIVCMPKNPNECQRIIGVGESGFGKSVGENSLVVYKSKDGIKIDKIKDILPGKDLEVMSLSGWTKIRAIVKHKDDRKKIKITTRTGKSIIGTIDHSFLIMDHYGNIQNKRGDNIQLGDCFIILKNIELIDKKNITYLLLKNKMNKEFTIQINNNFAFFLGIYLAEGYAGCKGNISISNQNADIKKRIQDFCDDNKFNLRYKNTAVEIHNSALQQWLLPECYYSKRTRKGKGSYAEIKKIPNLVYNQDKEFIINLLSGIFSGDGYIQNHNFLPKNRTKKTYDIGIGLCSERLIDDINFLLLSLGILCVKRSNGRRHDLRMSGRHATLFMKIIKLYGKKQNVYRVCENDHFDVIPFSHLIYDILKDNHVTKKWCDLGVKESKNKYGYMGRRRAERIIKKLKEINPNNEKLKKVEDLLKLNYFYDRIYKIEWIEPNGNVYDFETEDGTFVANGIVVHNSLLTNSLAGRLFWSGDRVGWIEDPMNQFYDMSLPQDYAEFNKVNALINNAPKPIPALQLYMACKYKLPIAHKNISLKLTLGFEEFLRKYKYYTYGIKDYDVGATIRYLHDYIDDIKDVESAEEIKDVMFEKVPNVKDKGMQAMIYKWKNTFETIFKEKFTSNLYDDDDATDELEVEFKDGSKMKGHPFVMAMEAGLVPVLNVSAARRQRWLRNYLADVMQKIVAHQMERGDKKHRMWVIADELNEIYEKGKKKDNASEAFQELYRQGRFNNIGFIGNTQSLDKLEPEMYKNASYIFSVYLQSGKDRKQFTDFKIDKEVYEQIGDLKAQEVMIFRSTKDPFVLYDKWGRRKVITGSDRRWFKGRIIPPINYHKVPGEKEKIDELKEVN